MDLSALDSLCHQGAMLPEPGLLQAPRGLGHGQAA